MASARRCHGGDQLRQGRSESDQRGGDHALRHGHARGRLRRSGDDDLCRDDDSGDGGDELEDGQPCLGMPMFGVVLVLGSSLTGPAYRKVEVGCEQGEQ